MNVVVIGANGQVGAELAEQHRLLQDTVVGTTNREIGFPSCEKLDISNYQDVLRFFNNLKVYPNVVYLAAAITNVDLCETEPDKTWQTNVRGVSNVVKAIRVIAPETLLIFYSSDFVFDGKLGSYIVGDIPNPINKYGQQKLHAEHIIATTLSKYSIIRTHSIYGPKLEGKNSLNWIVNDLKNGKVIKAAIDEWGNPTSLRDLVNASISIAKLELDFPHSIYHVGGGSYCNKYRFILEVARRFEFDEKLIQPVKSIDLDRPALRPLNGGVHGDGLRFNTSSYIHGLLECRNANAKNL